MMVPGARGAEVDDLLLPLGLELVGIVGDQAGLVGIGPLLGVALRARKHETEGCNQHPGQVTEIRHAKLSLRAREQIVRALEPSILRALMASLGRMRRSAMECHEFRRIRVAKPSFRGDPEL
jgi:hypothetical protein